MQPCTFVTQLDKEDGCKTLASDVGTQRKQNVQIVYSITGFHHPYLGDVCIIIA